MGPGAGGGGTCWTLLSPWGFGVLYLTCFVVLPRALTAFFALYLYPYCRTLLKPMGLGSVGDYCAHNAGCAVEVVEGGRVHKAH